jgi:AraC-like DNA-binding protein
VTHYHQQVLSIRHTLYQKEYLVQQVIHAKLYIDRNYTDNISLGKMAGKAFYSKYHFLRLFRSFYGRTPGQYLRSLRIEKAKHLLAAGKPVTEVCYSIGFDSVTSFTALFKKTTGSTPSGFISRDHKKPVTPFIYQPV